MGMVWEACGKGVPLLGVPGELPTTISMIRSRHEKGFKIMNPLSHMWHSQSRDIFFHALRPRMRAWKSSSYYVLIIWIKVPLHMFIYASIFINLFIYPSIHPHPAKNKTQPIHIPPLITPWSPSVPLQSLALKSPCSRCHNPRHYRQRWKGCRPLRQVKWM